MKAYNIILQAITISVLLLSFPVAISAQDYIVNWSDTSTYRVNCGKVIPAQWSVKNDSCVMLTPFLRVEAASGCQVSFTFRINQSGNGESTDKCYVWHSVDDAEWISDTVITAGQNPAVFSYSDQVLLNYGHFIRFRVAMRTNSNTEFWAIKGGDITVTDGNNSLTMIMPYSSRPPLLPDSDPYLPVELLIFTAQSGNEAVNISWATASETNNDYFSVEKSFNGFDYEVIGIVQGAGNSNEVLNYQFHDGEILQDGLFYYRLKQTDFDGNYEYIASTYYLVNQDNNAGSIIFSCSPQENVINISLTSLQDQYMHIAVYDLSGNEILSSDKDVFKGLNLVQVNANGIAEGLYIVKAEVKGQSFSGKIII